MGIWLLIAQDSPEAADRFIDRVMAIDRTLARFPEMGRSRDEIRAGIRSMAVGSYVIYHRQIRKGIEILRLVHGARDSEPLFDMDS